MRPVRPTRWLLTSALIACEEPLGDDLGRSTAAIWGGVDATSSEYDAVACVAWDNVGGSTARCPAGGASEPNPGWVTTGATTGARGRPR